MKIASLMPFLSALLTTLPGIAQQMNLSETEAEAIGTEAYIYGYPLITMDMTRQVMTNVETPNGMRAPMGQFAHAREYPNASFTDVTAPNADTLYSVAWLDLKKEPYILHVPDENNRYYLMPMLDGWTNVFSDPGTRTTGTRAGDFIITGPGWQGQPPMGVIELKSPTNMVWILGRTYCTGTPEDYKAVHEIQDKYSLIPLSEWGKRYSPPKGKFDPDVDMQTPVRDQVNAMDAVTYFKKLAALMKDNPPTPDDAPILTKMAKIGLVPGKEFDIGKLEPGVVRALMKTPTIAIDKITAHEKDAGKVENGWVVLLKTGTYGTDYLRRALVTFIGLGANKPQDAIHPTTSVDSEGNPLNGNNRYLIHFDREQIPPVNGFWSLTMYSGQYFFVNNPLDRYTLSPRDTLKMNSDGSLDLYIQNESPGKDKESNWLPAPKGPFILMLRLYWPRVMVLYGKWHPPSVQKLK